MIPDPPSPRSFAPLRWVPHSSAPFRTESRNPAEPREGWFKVPTPLGSYNPDWAVLVQDAEGERPYLVVETQGSLFMEDLRDKESANIACGKAHFETLFVQEPRARYQVGRELGEVLR